MDAVASPTTPRRSAWASELEVLHLVNAHLQKSFSFRFSRCMKQHMSPHEWHMPRAGWAQMCGTRWGG